MASERSVMRQARDDAIGRVAVLIGTADNEYTASDSRQDTHRSEETVPASGNVCHQRRLVLCEWMRPLSKRPVEPCIQLYHKAPLRVEAFSDAPALAALPPRAREVRRGAVRVLTGRVERGGARRQVVIVLSYVRATKRESRAAVAFATELQ